MGEEGHKRNRCYPLLFAPVSTQQNTRWKAYAFLVYYVTNLKLELKNFI